MIDIDECVQNVCSQGCTNTQGSYSCTCYAGFELSPDKVSCEGMWCCMFGLYVLYDYSLLHKTYASGPL